MAKPGPKQLLVFLQPLKAGDIVSEAEVLRSVPAWKKITLDTYRKKNKLDPLLNSLPNGDYRVVRDGQGLLEADINAALSQVATPKMVLSRGDILTGERDSYRLDCELGGGAVGLVWRAKTVSSGEQVAVKVCAPRDDLLAKSVLPNVLDRFRRESRLGEKLEHDALVRYVDFGSC